MGLHHLLLSRTTSNFSLVLLQAVEDLVVLWFVLCHHPSKLVSSLVNANSATNHKTASTQRTSGSLQLCRRSRGQLGPRQG